VLRHPFISLPFPFSIHFPSLPLLAYLYRLYLNLSAWIYIPQGEKKNIDGWRHLLLYMRVGLGLGGDLTVHPLTWPSEASFMLPPTSSDETLRDFINEVEVVTMATY